MSERASSGQTTPGQILPDRAIARPEEAAPTAAPVIPRPLLNLIPGAPSGDVCGPDGC